MNYYTILRTLSEVEGKERIYETDFRSLKDFGSLGFLEQDFSTYKMFQSYCELLYYSPYPERSRREGEEYEADFRSLKDFGSLGFMICDFFTVRLRSLHRLSNIPILIGMTIYSAFLSIFSIFLTSFPLD